MKPRAPVPAASQRNENQKVRVRSPELRQTLPGKHCVIMNSGWTITGPLATGRQARAFLFSLGVRRAVLRVPSATNSREAEVYAALDEILSEMFATVRRAVVQIELQDFSAALVSHSQILKQLRRDPGIGCCHLRSKSAVLVNK